MAALALGCGRRGDDGQTLDRGFTARRSRCCGLAAASSSCRRTARWTSTRIITTIMLDYDFMRTAFLAGTIVAIVCGAVGYFLVLRNLTFAGHALSHVGFAGATGAVLIGVAPLWGLVAFTLGAGTAMGLLGDRLRGRDVAVGIILTLSLGFGVLFLHFYTSLRGRTATALLFGNVLGVGMAQVDGTRGAGGGVADRRSRIISAALLVRDRRSRNGGGARRLASSGFGPVHAGGGAGGGGGDPDSSASFWCSR